MFEGATSETTEETATAAKEVASSLSFADCSCDHVAASSDAEVVEYTCGLFKLRLCAECGKLFDQARP